ncbi:unnamed protein product [Trifolium pratense]|uniref:Uncharacterized protein n=1 Tax=Trifolium pratense TaxID=57577 RepID=A0ACB0LK33_TRIPR|nr:unnamed protein product [Trifolium pratense]
MKLCFISYMQKGHNIVGIIKFVYVMIMCLSLFVDAFIFDTSMCAEDSDCQEVTCLTPKSPYCKKWPFFSEKGVCDCIAERVPYVWSLKN